MRQPVDCAILGPRSLACWPIDDLTLEMNRARQAEITQEIMEVVAGAEALS